jgi:hypothetical protein
MDHLRGSRCGAKVHDPYVYPNICLDDAISGSDCLVLPAGHQDYEDLAPEFLADKIRSKNAFVARMFNSQNRWARAGFKVMQLANRAVPTTNIADFSGIAANGSLGK